MKRLPRILCIDENADAREILEFMLRQIGFEVVASASARDAINLARQISFSMIISEYVLQDLDAADLCGQIKQFDPHVPIVFYSIESRKAHKERGLSAGAKAFLVKPDDLDDIERTVQSVALT